MWGGSRTVAGMTAIPFGARQAGRHLVRRSRRPEMEREHRSLRLAATLTTQRTEPLLQSIESAQPGISSMRSRFAAAWLLTGMLACGS